MFTDFPDEANKMIEDILGDHPGEILALAVKAEYQIKVGEVDEGLALIEKLMTGRRLPPWLEEHLEALRTP